MDVDKETGVDDEALKSIISRANRSIMPAGDPQAQRKADQKAAYIFDLLAGLRKLASEREYAFLSYLMGVAAEEALRLAEGLPSAGPRHSRSKPESPVTEEKAVAAKRHSA